MPRDLNRYRKVYPSNRVRQVLEAASESSYPVYTITSDSEQLDNSEVSTTLQADGVDTIPDSWSLSVPAGSSTSVVGVEATVTFTPDLPGVYVLTAVVDSKIVAKRAVFVNTFIVLTVLDLSAGSERDPNSLKGASTSLGTTSTIEIAANHGQLDTSLDAYVNIQNIGAIPSGKNTLVVQFTMETQPPAGPTAGTAYVTGIVLPTDGELVSGTGYYGGGFGMTNTNVNRIVNPNNVGTGLTNTSGWSGTDPSVCTWLVRFEDVDTTPNASATTSLASSSTGGGVEGAASDTGGCVGTFSEVWLGISLNQTDATPGAAVTFTGIQIKYMWI